MHASNAEVDRPTCCFVDAAVTETASTELMGSFQPTLASYIGHNLSGTDIKQLVGLNRIRDTAAVGFSSEPYVASLMSDKALCSQIAALNPKEVLDIGVHEVQQSLRVKTLASVRDPVALVMLCVRCIQEAGLAQFYEVPDPTVTSTLAKLHKLRQQKTGKTMTVDTALSHHLALLRSMMLTTKAAVISPDDQSDPDILFFAKQYLWSTSQQIYVALHANTIKASEMLAKIPGPDTPLFGDLKQARHMSSLIIQLIIPVLRQHLKEDHPEYQHRKENLVICYNIMECMLVATKSPVLQMISQTVADEIAKSGMPRVLISILACLL